MQKDNWMWIMQFLIKVMQHVLPLKFAVTNSAYTKNKPINNIHTCTSAHQIIKLSDKAMTQTTLNLTIDSD